MQIDGKELNPYPLDSQLGVYHWRQKMAEKREKEIIGYFTDDKNIYCVECINQNREIMESIEKAITTDDANEVELFCDGCNKEIK